MFSSLEGMEIRGSMVLTASIGREWPASYHGTGKGFTENIAKEGYDLK